jgi:ABC-2 type transport system permease protein
VTGLVPLLRIQWRTRRRSLAVWVAGLVSSLAATAASIAHLYDTPAQIKSYGDAVVSDALVAINGRVEGIDSLGGIVQDEFGFIASFLLPLFGIVVVASVTRREEEAGRLEALLAGRIGRRAPALASLLLVLVAVAVTIAGFAASLLVAGIAASGAVLYSLSLGLLTLVFAALAAVCAQVVLHARGVYILGFAVVGVSYALRGVGDVTGTGWVWLSPLGWVEKAAPFADAQRWWVLAIPLLVTLTLAAAAVLLADRRDLGGALYRPGPGPAAASRRLVRPIGLAAYIQRSSFAGWLVGSIALAAVMGALANEVIDAVLGNQSLSNLVAFTSDDAADGFLALTQVYLAIIACGYIVQALDKLRHEEADDRLEPILAGAVSRPHWLSAQLVVVIGGLVVLVVASAVVLGVATALSTSDSGYVATLLGAGLAYLPAELVFTGIAVALFGLAPRMYAVAWACFGVATFIALLGQGLQMPQWMLDISPTTHIGNPPLGNVDTLSLVVLTLISAALVVTGFAAFRRRLIPQG